MSFEVVAYRWEHLAGMTFQASQKHYAIGEAQAKGVDNGLAWTGLFDGRPIACAGLVPIWPGRYEAWAFFCEDFPTVVFPAIHAAAIRRMNKLRARRIETPLDPTAPNAARWARLLGFEIEGTMRGYAPDGRDMLLAARVHV